MNKLIANISNSLVPIANKKIDCRDAVNWLKENGGEWRQMEVPGFFFEHWVRLNSLAGVKGPYRAGSFCGRLKLPIEIKSHCNQSKTSDIMLNSLDNTLSLLNEYKKILIVVGLYDAEMDVNNDFRRFHADLKGGEVTNYKGCYHRCRKVSMRFNQLKWFVLDPLIVFGKSTEHKAKIVDIRRNLKLKIGLNDIDQIMKENEYYPIIL